MEQRLTKVKYIPARVGQRAWWDDLWQLDSSASGPKAVQIYEDDGGPQPTGLLDANGNELFRVREKNPVGFKWSKQGE